MNAKDLSLSNLKINNLVYGKSGTGKTTWACGFPKPFVFDFDGGMLSQRGRDVEYETYGVSGEMKGIAFQKFEAKLKEFESKPGQFETYILDSITTMQEYRLEFLTSASGKPRPTQYEWGMLVLDLRDYMLRLTKLKGHLVVIAHEVLVQDEVTGEVLVEPVIYGKKLPAQLPLWFDEVYRAQTSRTSKSEVQFEMLTYASTKYSAKSRLGCLPEVLVWSRGGKPMNSYQLVMEKMKGVEGGK